MLTWPSGTGPAMKVFLLPNQLPLFLLFRLGAWLVMVAGEPGRSDLRLSEEERVRMPRNLRTDVGRLLEGLVGDMVLAPSLVRLSRGYESRVKSSDGFSGGGDSLWGGEVGDLGVGWEESGPLPGVGGRGESGGLSSGAGIEVPSVREKLIGVSVNGLYWNFVDDMAGRGRRVDQARVVLG